MKKTLIAIEAVVCGVPCIGLAMGGLPILLYSGFLTLSHNIGEGATVMLCVLGVCFALFQYVRLSLQTIKQQPYRFGWPFWIAAVFAVIGLWWFLVSFGILATAMSIGPIFLATAHFITLQLRRRTFAPEVA